MFFLLSSFFNITNCSPRRWLYSGRATACRHILSWRWGNSRCTVPSAQPITVYYRELLCALKTCSTSSKMSGGETESWREGFTSWGGWKRWHCDPGWLNSGWDTLPLDCYLFLKTWGMKAWLSHSAHLFYLACSSRLQEGLSESLVPSRTSYLSTQTHLDLKLKLPMQARPARLSQSVLCWMVQVPKHICISYRYIT